MAGILCDVLARIADNVRENTLAAAHTAVAAQACKSLGPDERLDIMVGRWDIEQMSRTHMLERRYLAGSRTWMLTLTPRGSPAA